MKLSAGIAGTAFILSLLIGAISGASFVLVLLRALFFAALFFGLGFGAHQLISRFLPELLGPLETENTEVDSGLGSRIDLVVGDEGERPMAEVKDAAERLRKRPTVENEEEEAEEIEAFMPIDGVTQAAAATEAEKSDVAGLDQGTEGRYTQQRDAGGLALEGKGVEAALPPGLIDDVDVLPDLESMTDSFVSPLVEEATERSSGESFPSRPSSTSRSSEIGGDFDPREMASAIQTILKRDQKG
jgi:hypothetical protein